MDRTNATRQARWRERRKQHLAALEAEVVELRAALAARSLPPARRGREAGAAAERARVATLAGRV
jgi:hypothetical protein